jgi:hypothetical protein
MAYRLSPLSLVLLLAPLALTACETPPQIVEGETIITPSMDPPDSPADSPANPPGDSVCDPFGENGGLSGTPANLGLHARLHYLTEDQPHYTHVDDYLQNGAEVPNDLFFSQLNIPTRPFDRGFLTQDGNILTRPSGDTLYEWFALHFESRIRLSAEDRPGRYQFAVLSDDGSILKLDPNGGGFATHINNDGLTPTRMGCATSTVTLDAASRLPMQLDYYQGPRTHIALMLLWREIPDDADASALADPACGTFGNDRFFNSAANPPVPTAVFQGLLNRGWKVLGPENFLLPERFDRNPCDWGGAPPA